MMLAEGLPADCAGQGQARTDDQDFCADGHANDFFTFTINDPFLLTVKALEDTATLLAKTASGVR